jgi:hypothetical protein
MLVIAVGIAAGAVAFAVGRGSLAVPVLAPPSVGDAATRTPDALLASTPPPYATPRLAAVLRESCEARGVIVQSSPGEPPGLISGDLGRPWRCDGDGARLRPPQHADLAFPNAARLVAFAVLGFDVTRPCRFVTRLQVLVAQQAYEAVLPAHRYPAPIWFRLPPIESDRLTLTVLATVRDAAWATDCGQTSLAGLAFSGT